MKNRILLALALILLCAPFSLRAADPDQVDKVWKGGNKELLFGYNTGSFDLGSMGGKLESRWGASITSIRNIGLHKPIAGMLKFGIHLGQQIDYLDNPDTIGWVRQGQDCAMAVVLTDGPAGSKQMCVGAGMAETIFVDLLGGREEQILIPENGMADFPVNGGSVSVWLPQDMARLISLALHRRQSSTTI